MSYRTAEMHRRAHSLWRCLACLGCVVLASAACTPPGAGGPPYEPPDKGEQREEMKTRSVEPKETRGAPYPPAELDQDFIPNVEEEKWEPVPEGPVRGDLQPTNSAVEIKEAEIERDPKDKQDN